MKRTGIINRIASELQRVAPDAEIILYGSEARGDALPDSDIDLLILIDGDKISIAQEEEITTPLYQIELETGVPIHPIVMLKKNWFHRPFNTPFYINVMNEGIALWNMN